uniref:Uncharacterized protein n=1 Tax=Timema douglasi TaxID=61478 RepID=A0A7R8VGZ0_TIMDO|nr:unnamed protein product [Timema douglasi]
MASLVLTDSSQLTSDSQHLATSSTLEAIKCGELGPVESSLPTTIFAMYLAQRSAVSSTLAQKLRLRLLDHVTPPSPIPLQAPILILLIIGRDVLNIVCQGLCEVDTGQSSIILDMEESRDTRLHHDIRGKVASGTPEFGPRPPENISRLSGDCSMLSIVTQILCVPTFLDNVLWCHHLSAVACTSLELNQATSPAELPIVGDPFSEIVLELVFPKGLPLFILNGKKLQLLKPLDRDEENLSHIVFQVRTHFFP